MASLVICRHCRLPLELAPDQRVWTDREATDWGRAVCPARKRKVGDGQSILLHEESFLDLHDREELEKWLRS